VRQRCLERKYSYTSVACRAQIKFFFSGGEVWRGWWGQKPSKGSNRMWGELGRDKYKILSSYSYIRRGEILLSGNQNIEK
jgi:hypothetical protein